MDILKGPKYALVWHITFNSIDTGKKIITPKKKFSKPRTAKNTTYNSKKCNLVLINK